MGVLSRDFKLDIYEGNCLCFQASLMLPESQYLRDMTAWLDLPNSNELGLHDQANYFHKHLMRIIIPLNMRILTESSLEAHFMFDVAAASGVKDWPEVCFTCIFAGLRKHSARHPRTHPRTHPSPPGLPGPFDSGQKQATSTWVSVWVGYTRDRKARR